jgi:hypothetical protein
MLEKSKEAGKPPAAPAKGKDGAVEKVDPANQMFAKEACLAFAEAMKESWFEEEELKELWDETKGFPRKDKEGKATDFVSRKDMISFYLDRCFAKKLIKESRFSAYEKKFKDFDHGRVETSILDFNLNDFLSDIKVHCEQRNSYYQ